MSNTPHTFSDAWHRVAGVQVALRNSVRAHRQQFQGEVWVILSDTISSDWYRISADAYRFISQLTLTLTIDEVWLRTYETEPELALSQEEVVQLLGQLNIANLLQYDRGSTAAALFDRYRKRRSRERQAKWMGILAIKMPLFDPDRLLERWQPWFNLLFSGWGLGAYLLLLLSAAWLLLSQSAMLFSQGAGILATDNLLLLYASFVVTKLIHEFGHASACKYYGGEVHTMGVMLLLFAPLPYMDASASWGFRRRGQRMLTALAGALAELAVAALATLVWVYSAPGTINALAYNVIFAASISTLLFNLNPLLRFDGYHILVDVLNIPNMYQRSRQQLVYLAERFIFRLPNAHPVARSRAEVVLLPLYGVVSLIYWLLLMVFIIVFISNHYLDFGLMLAWLLTFSVVVIPLFNLLRYLFTSPKLVQRRGRTLVISSVLLVMPLVGLGRIPVADRVRVNGVLEATQFRQIHSEASGTLAELYIQPGHRVVAGAALVRLDNPQLPLEIAAVTAHLEELQAKEQRAISNMVADVEPLREQRQAVLRQLADLEQQRAALTLTAPITGIWHGSDDEIAPGRWVVRGDTVGAIVDSGDWRFVAVLPQINTYLFETQPLRAEIRLHGREDENLEATRLTIIPHGNGLLPSAALGMAGGGEIAIDPSDTRGLTAAEPFFRIQAQLIDIDQTQLRHGHLGMMRLTLPDQPLLLQWQRRVRQFFQKQFRV